MPPSHRRATPSAIIREHGFLILIYAFAAVFYGWLLTRGTFDIFGAEPLGLTFNSMLDHMLRGRWDVDPAAIGFEAFIRNGRTYAYFGPFPALLRLPLLLVPHRLLPDWHGLQVERLSCWLAIMLGIIAQHAAVIRALADAPDAVGRALIAPLVVVCAMSGAPMLLALKGALLYHEPILWAWALAMLFVSVALPTVRATDPPSWQRLCVMAACAGFCLLARSTTGAGLILALGLLLARTLLRPGNELSWWRRGLRPEVWRPGLVLGSFLALTGLVNLERWGNPLTFADLRLQTIIIVNYPDRVARLQRHGLFDPHRLDIGLLYYLFPVWTQHLNRVVPLQARLADLYDAVEQPASSLLLTDPAWCLLSLLGAMVIIRRRATIDEALMAGGLSLAPVLMLTAWYLAFRYRIEFAPLLVALSCIGLRDRTVRIAPSQRRWITLELTVLCILQILGAGFAGFAYGHAPLGPSQGYQALSLHCTLYLGSCDAAGAAP